MSTLPRLWRSEAMSSGPHHMRPPLFGWCQCSSLSPCFCPRRWRGSHPGRPQLDGSCCGDDGSGGGGDREGVVWLMISVEFSNGRK